MPVEALVRTLYQMDNEQILNCPYPTLDKLRSYGPFVPSGERQWLCLDYATAKALLTHRDFGRGEMYRVPPLTSSLSPVEVMRKNWMLYCDGADHAKLKRFTLSVLDSYLDDELKATTEAISRDLLSQIDPSSPFDFVKEYAYPLPLLIIADLLGVPRADRDHFKRWSALVNRTLEPCVSAEAKAESDHTVQGLYAYFEQLIESGQVPQGSILDKLINGKFKGEGFTKDEVIYTAILLLIAGHETTSSMAALGMLTLTKFPDLYDRLREDPTLVPAAIEELLRYEAPVQMARRLALKETEVAGKPFKEGDMVTVHFGAVNYDPLVFDHPYALQLNRPTPHMAFGYGPHFCLGAKLARLEGAVAFTHLTSLLPKLKRREGPIHWKKNLVLRGLESLFLATDD